MCVCVTILLLVLDSLITFLNIYKYRYKLQTTHIWGFLRKRLNTRNLDWVDCYPHTKFSRHLVDIVLQYKAFQSNYDSKHSSLDRKSIRLKSRINWIYRAVCTTKTYLFSLERNSDLSRCAILLNAQISGILVAT